MMASRAAIDCGGRDGRATAVRTMVRISGLWRGDPGQRSREVSRARRQMNGLAPFSKQLLSIAGLAWHLRK